MRAKNLYGFVALLLSTIISLPAGATESPSPNPAAAAPTEVSFSVRYWYKNHDDKSEQEARTRIHARLGTETLVRAVENGESREELWVTPTFDGDSYYLQFCRAQYRNQERICVQRPRIGVLPKRTAELREDTKRESLKLTVSDLVSDEEG